MALTEVQWPSITSPRDSKDISPSLKVRRCLFGPVDHALVRSDLQREMRSMVEDGIRRWNFDFEKETPLKGRYLWQKVSTNDVPSSSIAFNSRTFNSRDSNCSKRAIVDVNSSTTTTTTTTSTRCEKSTTQAKKTTDKNPRKRIAINKITGFLKQKKPRSHTTLDNKDSPSLTKQTRLSIKQTGQMRLDKFLN